MWSFFSEESVRTFSMELTTEVTGNFMYDLKLELPLGEWLRDEPQMSAWEAKLSRAYEWGCQWGIAVVSKQLKICYLVSKQLIKR